MALVQLGLGLFLTCILHVTMQAQSQKRARDFGIHIGVLKTGKLNSITDVNGLTVGHSTIKKGDSINTGVTVILPHQGNIFQQKVPAAVYTGNGFGKLAGSTQINELGNIETPIALTNTLSVPAAMNGLITHTLAQTGNEKISSVNAVVGETNDGFLNDIRGRYVKEENVLEAIKNATSTQVMEGAVGAGTGTVCFGFKGGIGTASRKLPVSLGGYTIGVLVQSNFGGVLTIDGVAVGENLQKFSFSYELLNNVDGSCMIVVATDAPLDHRNLMRMAKRAMLGLGRTGGIASNGSGDYVIAFSTFEQNRVLHQTNNEPKEIRNLPNDAISPLFMATIEATEEAIINSLLTATDTKGFRGNKVSALPIQQLVPLFIKEKNE